MTRLFNCGRIPGSDIVYAPFGEMRAPTDLTRLTKLTDFTFTGQRLDRSTGGLMYYGARYYLPGIQHFISADTIVPGAGLPQNLNRYAYVRGNPVKLNDPTGHRTCDWYDETGGCVSATVNDWIAADQYELSRYGVKVSFDAGIRVSQQLVALRETKQAVKTLARQAKQTIDSLDIELMKGGQKPFFYDSVKTTDAFKMIFGPTLLDVKTSPLCCTPAGDNYFGENLRGTTNGVQVLTMYVGGFRDSGNNQSGPTWVAHEIGHSLELDYGGNGNFGTPLLGSAPIRELIEPQSGKWSSSTGELTPDIIAAWAFDAYNYDERADLASAFRNNASMWMSGVITDILRVSSTQ